jgi:hypothetical protein
MDGARERRDPPDTLLQLELPAKRENTGVYLFWTEITTLLLLLK